MGNALHRHWCMAKQMGAPRSWNHTWSCKPPRFQAACLVVAIHPTGGNRFPWPATLLAASFATSLAPLCGTRSSSCVGRRKVVNFLFVPLGIFNSAMHEWTSAEDESVLRNRHCHDPGVVFAKPKVRGYEAIGCAPSLAGQPTSTASSCICYLVANCDTTTAGGM